MSFLLRAPKSAFAMMRAIMAPVIFADYLFFMTPGICLGYFKQQHSLEWNWLHTFVYQHLYFFSAHVSSALTVNVRPFFVATIVGTACRFNVLLGMVYVPLCGLALYAFIVWHYLPYLEQYAYLELPRYLPVGFISELKTIRLRALRGFVEEHTRWLDSLRSYKRTRAK